VEAVAWISTVKPSHGKSSRKMQRSASTRMSTLEAECFDAALQGLDSLAGLNGEDGTSSDVGAAALLASLSWLHTQQQQQPSSGACPVPPHLTTAGKASLRGQG
jgi:hypothetical protein